MLYIKKISFLILLFTILNIFSTNNIFDKLSKEKNKTEKKRKDSINKEYLISLNYYKERKYKRALKRSLSLYNECNQYLSAILIADIYKKTSNYKKAIKYYKIALKLFNKDKSNLVELKLINKDSINLFYAKTFLQIGATYQKLHNIELTKNKTYFNQYKDTAIIFYDKIEQINLLNEKSNKFKAVSFYNLSAIYSQDSLFEIAKEFAKKSINIYIKTKDNKNLSRSFSNLGSIYLSSKNYIEAKKYYNKGLDLIRDDNSQESIKIKTNLYYNLAWAMRNLKDYKAYDYQELSYEIEDSQRDKEIRKIIEEITVKHKENLEQQKINLITEQRKLIEAKDNKTTLLFGALSLLVIIISGFIIYNYKLRQQNLQLVLSENNLKQLQSIEKLKSDTNTKILNATIDAKESERKQIAEILHDSVSALLSSANMHLSATKKQFKSTPPPIEIEKTQSIILEAAEKVRDLSHNLISSILLKFGLEYALKDIAKKYSNSQLNFDVSAQNIHRYNQEFEIKIFNIIQELANNILKHSKANYAQIILKQEKNQLTTLVYDDGVGFTTSSSSHNKGIGLNQIQARIEMMKGTISIDSKINKGTKICIIIPIQK
ncbi:tetratricopeptide repeat-containing sensor histidine kinase [Tenacibaculum aestuariivivum]|uniref:tetratricopeptide repeat-containing sensor histidine kinase n=1 Tax=Tenacibaculum aestuariivivum TaxID=2006131 RepID=UPI003AB3A66E